MLEKVPSIYNILTESIDVQGFDMEEFKKLTTFQNRVNYCDTRLERLNAGSARVVYKISNDKVLKLAKNKKGLAQNEVEIDQGRQPYLKGIVAQVFEFEPNNLWLTVQYYTPINKIDFKNIVGIDFNDYWDILQYEDYTIHPAKYRLAVTKITPPKIEGYWENEFVSNILDYIAGYDLPIGDLQQLSSYGKTSDGDIVVIDYGFNEDVSKLYARKRI